MTPAEALASAIMEVSDHCDIPNSQGLVTPVETARILAALDAAGWTLLPKVDGGYVAIPAAELEEWKQRAWSTMV